MVKIGEVGSVENDAWDARRRIGARRRSRWSWIPGTPVIDQDPDLAIDLLLDTVKAAR